MSDFNFMNCNLGGESTREAASVIASFISGIRYKGTKLRLRLQLNNFTQDDMKQIEDAWHAVGREEPIIHLAPAQTPKTTIGLFLDKKVHAEKQVQKKGQEKTSGGQPVEQPTQLSATNDQ